MFFVKPVETAKVSPLSKYEGDKKMANITSLN
jgi:hypothetical protein